MNDKVSVGINTKHRIKPLNNFIESFISTTNKVNTPHLTLLYHNVTEKSRPDNVSKIKYINEFHTYHDNGCGELWNKLIMASPTDWVLITQDDIVFKPGWLDYLEKQIDTGKYIKINLFAYSAFCIHKSIINMVGWFDERYRGGGFEDIDYQLRINEAGLKNMVDRSHDFIHMDGKKYIGHFVEHHKSPNNTPWIGNNNEEWIVKKWGRKFNNEGLWNWRLPSYRQCPEIDFHPMYSMRYSEKFNLKNTWIDNNGRSIAINREIYP